MTTRSWTVMTTAQAASISARRCGALAHIHVIEPFWGTGPLLCVLEDFKVSPGIPMPRFILGISRVYTRNSRVYFGKDKDGCGV